MFSGTILLLIGAVSITVQLKRMENKPQSLFGLAQALIVVTLLFFVFPFVSGSLPAVLLTPIMVVLLMLVGLIKGSYLHCLVYDSEGRYF